MKGIISIVELVIVALVLFTAFGILFPGTNYTNRWQEVEIVLKSRDLLIALDKTGDMYKKSFSSEEISEFIASVFPERDLFSWIEADGALKSRIVVACDCTEAQTNDLIKWVGNTKINGRTIALDFVPLANFNNIPNSDVMLIFGYRDLTAYKQNLKDYLNKGSGIVEIVDLDSSAKIDSVQSEIFGLKWVETASDTFDTAKFSRKPTDSKDVIYFPYKHFYHAPLRLIGDFSNEEISGCTADPIFKGKLTVKQTNYAFWICSTTTVWFDNDADGDRDVLIDIGNEVILGDSKFFLNYIDFNTIGLSFRTDYTFQDFLGPGTIFHIEPTDSTDRVVIYSESTSPAKKFPAVIVNPAGRVAWIADFTDSTVGDDERLLLASLLHWSSSKKTQGITGNIKFGYSTSYLNADNTDMFEVYRFDLGLGFPF